jgi:hypothetical protein
VLNAIAAFTGVSCCAAYWLPELLLRSGKLQRITDLQDAHFESEQDDTNGRRRYVVAGQIRGRRYRLWIEQQHLMLMQIVTLDQPSDAPYLDSQQIDPGELTSNMGPHELALPVDEQWCKQHGIERMVRLDNQVWLVREYSQQAVVLEPNP